jgi:hypothetical protein
MRTKSRRDDTAFKIPRTAYDEHPTSGAYLFVVQ